MMRRRVAILAWLVCLCWSMGCVLAGMYFDSRYIALYRSSFVASGPVGPASTEARRALWMSDTLFQTGIGSFLVTLVGAGGLMILFARQRTRHRHGFDVIQ